MEFTIYLIFERLQVIKGKIQGQVQLQVSTSNQRYTLSHRPMVLRGKANFYNQSLKFSFKQQSIGISVIQVNSQLVLLSQEVSMLQLQQELIQTNFSSDQLVARLIFKSVPLINLEQTDTPNFDHQIQNQSPIVSQPQLSPVKETRSKDVEALKVSPKQSHFNPPPVSLPKGKRIVRSQFLQTLQKKLAVRRQAQKRGMTVWPVFLLLGVVGGWLL